MLDLCGDYIRYHGSAIGLGAMTELLRAFDVSAENVRVVMSRLRREGFFDTTRDGRTTTYVLTPHTLRTLDEGRDRIFTRDIGPWTGAWHMVIYQVPESERDRRERLRTGLAWLGFGPLASSTWISAHDRRAGVDELFGDAGLARVDQMTSRTSGLAEDRALARRCWDLDQLADGYREWMRHWQTRIDADLDDRQALVARIEMVHDYRKFPFSDPDLPAELLPGDWPGAAAHELFLKLYDTWAGPAMRFYEGVTGTSGRIPTCDL